jgi:hypothetical protein
VSKRTKILSIRQPKNKWSSWQALGLIVSVAFMITFLILNVVMIEMGMGHADRTRGEWTWSIILIVIQTPLILSCWFFYSRFSNLRRKLRARDANQLMEHDKRAPILYLRSFADDTNTGWAWMSPTEEEQLAVVLNEIGPFITIRQPLEELPEAGAARLDIGVDKWQNRIRDLVSKVQLVVLRVGETESLWWEIKLVLRKVAPERIVFLIPRNRKLYGKFRQKANQLLPYQLPEFKPKRVINNIAALLYFEPDWTPHIVKVRWSQINYRLRMKGMNEMAVAFRVAFYPVAKQLQIEWNFPSIRIIHLLGIGFLLLGFVILL